MTTIAQGADLHGLGVGSHVCWIVDDDATYLETAARVLRDGRSAGEKTFAFGIDGSPTLEALWDDADLVADPSLAFLGGGPLAPQAMFEGFRQQWAIARDEDFAGLRIMADMDWLLRTRATAEQIAAFELLLDGELTQLGATAVCAYRQTSFDGQVGIGAACVHPVTFGVDRPAQFRLHAGSDVWQLAGEVDCAVASIFAAAFTAATSGAAAVIDLSDLDFIDVGGMRTIAQAATSGPAPLRLAGASDRFRRLWHLGGFDQDAPSVEFVA